MLKTLGSFDVFSLHDFPHYIPEEEVGGSFEEIAIKKACHAANSLGKLVLADDSGLVVPSLAGAPGILSARYAGTSATDKDNLTKLLYEMQGLQETDRYAYLECCIAIASPEGLKKSSRGICEGAVLTEERGSSGFGYDSIFIKHDYSKTFGELDEEQQRASVARRRSPHPRCAPLLSVGLLQLHEVKLLAGLRRRRPLPTRGQLRSAAIVRRRSNVRRAHESAALDSRQRPVRTRPGSPSGDRPK